MEKETHFCTRCDCERESHVETRWVEHFILGSKLRGTPDSKETREDLVRFCDVCHNKIYDKELSRRNKESKIVKPMNGKDTLNWSENLFKDSSCESIDKIIETIEESNDEFKYSGLFMRRYSLTRYRGLFEAVQELCNDGYLVASAAIQSVTKSEAHMSFNRTCTEVAKMWTMSSVTLYNPQNKSYHSIRIPDNAFKPITVTHGTKVFTFNGIVSREKFIEDDKNDLLKIFNESMPEDVETSTAPTQLKIIM